MSHPLGGKPTKASMARQAAAGAKSKEIGEASGVDKPSTSQQRTPKLKTRKSETEKPRRRSSDTAGTVKAEAIVSRQTVESPVPPLENVEDRPPLKHSEKPGPLIQDDAPKEPVKQPQVIDPQHVVETGTFRPVRPFGFPEPVVTRRYPESAEAIEIRRLCVDFLDFKRTRLNDQKGMEQDMQTMFPRMDSMLKQVEALSKRISRIPSTTPSTEPELRVENDRLNYLITASAGIFRQIDMFLIALKEKIDVFTSMTTTSNEGIDERLRKIIKAICDRSKYHKKHGTSSVPLTSTLSSTLSTFSEPASMRVYQEAGAVGDMPGPSGIVQRRVSDDTAVVEKSNLEGTGAIKKTTIKPVSVEDTEKAPGKRDPMRVTVEILSESVEKALAALDNVGIPVALPGEHAKKPVDDSMLKAVAVLEPVENVAGARGDGPEGDDVAGAGGDAPEGDDVVAGAGGDAPEGDDVVAGAGGDAPEGDDVVAGAGGDAPEGDDVVAGAGGDAPEGDDVVAGAGGDAPEGDDVVAGAGGDAPEGDDVVAGAGGDAPEGYVVAGAEEDVPEGDVERDDPEGRRS